jgi:fatty acid/phospholipid biosynthesis enzyme
MSELDLALKDVDKQVNSVVTNLVAAGAHRISVSMADNVTRPLYKEMVKAHEDRVDVGHVEDALLSMITTGLLDFMLRVHGNANRGAVIEHLQTFINELAAVVSEEVVGRFTDGPATTESVEVH